jgi:phage gpG-like protein
MTNPIIKVEIKNPPREQKIADVDGMLGAMMAAKDNENQLTVAHIVRNYASFPQDEPTTMDGLRTISGRLRANYRASAPKLEGNNIVSAIGNNVEYAAIHEFGGQTRPHDIVARNAKALAFSPGTGKFFVATDFAAASHSLRGNARKAKADLFMDENGIVLRKVVHHPGSDIPARQPIQRGIEDRLPQYAESLGNAAAKFANS